MGSREEVAQTFRVPTVLTTTTAATGTNWVVLGNAAGGPVDCNIIDVDNTTGVELEFGFGSVGATVPTGAFFKLAASLGKPFFGITNSQALFVRRSDHSNSQVTFSAISYR